MKTALRVLAAFVFLGCNRTGGATPNPAGSTPAAVVAASSAPAASAPEAVETAVRSDGAVPCGALGCLRFDTPEAAFRHVLATRPLVLAIGEAHAQKDKAGVDSSAKRFTDTLLPFLQGKASDLVLELMMPNDRCEKKTERVREKQKEVTSQQREGNQNEYVRMGERARALGIVPDLLRPGCDDLAAIDKAGDDAIPVFLSTIARLTRVQVEKLLDRNARTPADADKLVVTFGGVLHNDLQPAPEKADWSFGPALARKVNQRYVEVDLFVPEFIEDTETWRKLAWFPHYDQHKMGDKTTLFQMSPGSYAMIFPVSESESP